jgi:esterase/lipase superfamily enzyme
MKQLIAFILSLILLASCGSSKHTSKTVTIVDSSSAQEYKSMYETERQLREHMEQQLRELQYAGIQFDTLPCPDKGGEVAPPVNTVTVDPSGAIHATGRIKSVNTSKAKSENKVQDKQATEDHRVNEERKDQKTAHTEQKTQEKEVKKPFRWWLWILIGIVIGILLRQLWPQIFKQLKRLWAVARLTIFPIIKR